MVVDLYEPDEAWAEHGLGSGDEGVAQGVHAAEAVLDHSGKVGRGLRYDVWVRVDAAEEEVVVEGHAGQVEGVGPCGIAGEFDDERLDVLALEGAASRYVVQLIDDVVLVLCEGGLEAGLREQAGDAIFDELVVPVQRRDGV